MVEGRIDHATVASVMNGFGERSAFTQSLVSII
jgi:hypothetical protein